MIKKVSLWKLAVAGVLAALLVGVAQPQAAEEKGRLETFQRKLNQRGFTVLSPVSPVEVTANAKQGRIARGRSRTRHSTDTPSMQASGTR